MREEAEDRNSLDLTLWSREQEKVEGTIRTVGTGSVDNQRPPTKGPRISGRGAREACGAWTPVEGQLSHKPRKFETQGPALITAPLQGPTINCIIILLLCIDEMAVIDYF